MQGYFKMFSGYTPVFTTLNGGIYEMELTRACIHAYASQCAKLKIEATGNARSALTKRLLYKPNPYMDTYKFLYRLATILEINTTAYIVPITDDTGTYIVGYYPILPSLCEVLEYKNEPWLRYTFGNGQKACIEFSRVGVLTKFQYDSDFFGSGNAALYPTLQLINTQNQGIIEGVKSSANIRFIAKLNNIFKGPDIEAERKRFTESNLSADNNSGVMMFDNKYSDVKQIVSKPFIIDDNQMNAIKANVFDYFGCNEKILQNNFAEDEWNAYYEGKIELFAIQTSLVMTNMTFTETELSYGNSFILSANRLQYASNKTKLEIVTQLFDRGYMTHNEGREIFNMSPISGGDKYFIRQEYIEVDKLDKAQGVNDKNEVEEGGTQDD